MKPLLLVAALVTPLSAFAQKLTATAEPKTYTVGKEKAPLYRELADTTKKAGFNISPGEDATVVGQFSPRWSIVKRQGFLYLTPTALLISPDGPPSLPDGTFMPFDADTKLATYQGVVEVAGDTKDQLYSRAMEWVAKTYNSAQAVVQMQDKESGKLIVKGLTRVNIRSYPAGVVKHTLSIYVKDGRYKYVVTDLTHDASATRNLVSGGPLELPDGKIFGMGGSKKDWMAIRLDAHNDVLAMVAQLQTALAVKPGKDASDF